MRVSSGGGGHGAHGCLWRDAGWRLCGNYDGPQYKTHTTRSVMLQVHDASIVPKARKRPLMARGFRTSHRATCRCSGTLRPCSRQRWRPAQVGFQAVRSVMAQPIPVATAAGQNPFRRYEATGTSKTSTSFIPFRPWRMSIPLSCRKALTSVSCWRTTSDSHSRKDVSAEVCKRPARSNSA